MVDAFLRAGAMEKADGQVFNLGGDEGVSLRDLAALLVEIAGHGELKVTPFPADRKKIDIGDFYADVGRIREALGWEPRVKLRDGLTRTVEYYQQHKEHYL